MNNCTKLNIVLNKDYKNLIKKDIYELIILDVMNLSQNIFTEQYIHIDNNKQSNGESDYMSKPSKRLFDVKTIFPTEQCKSLSTNDIQKFMESIINESSDTFSSIIDNNSKNLNFTILYKEIKRAIKNIKEIESLIIFIPYPFTIEYEKSLSSYLGSDIFSQIINKMKVEEPDIFNKQEIYFIYPNLENKIIIKSMMDNKIEYLKSNILSKYIYVKYLK